MMKSRSEERKNARFLKATRMRNARIVVSTEGETAHVSRLAASAFREAAKGMYRTSGFNVFVENGKVVKRFSSGQTVVIQTLEKVERPKNIVLL